MKTKLQNLFVAVLTFAASTQKLGINLIRVSILVIFVWIGSLKFWNYEAEGIVPFVANSPFMSFFYSKSVPEYKEYKLKEGEFNETKHQWHVENNTYVFSYGLGILIITIGILTFLGLFFPENRIDRSNINHYNDCWNVIFPCHHSRSMGTRFGKWGTWFSIADRSRTSGH